MLAHDDTISWPQTGVRNSGVDFDRGLHRMTHLRHRFGVGVLEHSQLTASTPVPEQQHALPAGDRQCPAASNGQAVQFLPLRRREPARRMPLKAASAKHTALLGRQPHRRSFARLKISMDLPGALLGRVHRICEVARTRQAARGRTARTADRPCSPSRAGCRPVSRRTAAAAAAPVGKRCPA